MGEDAGGGQARGGLFVCLFTLLAACAAEERVTVLRLAHSLDPGHPVHAALLHFADRARALSDGSLEVRVYPSGQLGDERELVELLQLGSVDFTKVAASVVESFTPEYALFSLPYLFEDDRERFRVLDGPVGADLLELPSSRRLRGLAFLDAGSRSFYTRERPIKGPEDLAGLKIRTQESATAIRLVNALGGHATPVSWGELYSALAQGVVDGAENNPPSYHRSRHFEVAPYYSLDRHTAVPDVLLVSEPTWQRLEPAHRQALRRAAHEAAAAQRAAWRGATERALTELRAAGVEILEPETASFRERVGELRDEAAADRLLGPWLDRIERARGAS